MVVLGIISGSLGEIDTLQDVLLTGEHCPTCFSGQTFLAFPLDDWAELSTMERLALPLFSFDFDRCSGL